jgi:hypothetical protein
MSSFDFRLRFNFPGNDYINHDGEEMLILEEPKGNRLRLLSGERGTQIKTHSRASIIGGPYSSIEEARDAAARAKKALLIWAVRQRIGIDLGDGHTRSVLTEAGRKMFESKLKHPVRNDIHGIDIYEHQEDLVFVCMNFKAALGKGAEAFTEQVASVFRASPELTEKQILAAELYCASFFDVSFRSRLITLITAIEALLEPAARPQTCQALVSELETVTRQANLDEPTKNAMLSSLQWLKQDSIGQTGRALAACLLGDREYSGMKAARFFAYCYELRSQILHFGKPEDDKVDLLALSNACQAFVADLLLASFYAKI